MQAYVRVVQGEDTYIQCNSYDGTMQEATLQTEIGEWYGYIFEIPLHFTAFSVTDLDADGSPELLLRLSDDFGFELLRYADGKVYGYPFFARAMEDVTVEGDIHGSNGADDFGWYQVIFGADHRMSIAEVCWKHDDLDGKYHYTVGDAEASENEFLAKRDEIEAKVRLHWIDFAPENIGTAAAGE